MGYNESVIFAFYTERLTVTFSKVICLIILWLLVCLNLWNLLGEKRRKETGYEHHNCCECTLARGLGRLRGHIRLKVCLTPFWRVPLNRKKVVVLYITYIKLFWAHLLENTTY